MPEISNENLENIEKSLASIEDRLEDVDFSLQLNSKTSGFHFLYGIGAVAMAVALSMSLANVNDILVIIVFAAGLVSIISGNVTLSRAKKIKESRKLNKAIEAE